MYDTSILSAALDTNHPHNERVNAFLSARQSDDIEYISHIALAELEFGLRLAERTGTILTEARAVLDQARTYTALGTTANTSIAYGDLKAAVASKYLPNLERKKRPRRVESWKDAATGEMLQIDENDLWMCAIALERDLTFVTSDSHCDRISNSHSGLSMRIVR